MDKITLDTHALIWYMEGIKLPDKQVSLIDQARSDNALFISAISIWEIAMLAGKGKIAFSVSLNDWVDNTLSIPGINVIELSILVLIESCNLPHFEHKDPADRLIIASARSINSYLMTFDQKIIGYGNQGYLKIIGDNA